MLRPRVAIGGALLTIVGLTAACSGNGSELPEPPLTHPEVGWVNGQPAAAQSGSQPGPATPNIVFVLTDDLSWNLVKYMPHVLAMRRAGVTFSNYFVTDSLCCPSRASIFTGEFPHNTGVLDNSGSDGGFDAFLAHQDQDKTFATRLQSSGYVTGFFGKYLNLYHPGVTYDGQRPYVAPGWSAWDAAGTSAYNEFDYLLTVGHHVARYGDDPGEYLTSVLANKATRFISTSVAAHKPFMTEISTFSPHSPYTPAPEDAESFPDLQAPEGPAYGQAVKDAPAWLKKIPPLDPSTERSLSRTFRLRVQDMQSVDRMIGRLEAKVQDLGVASNTYFIFSSDNGFHLGEYDLRAGKQTAFNTDIRVPLVVTGPDVPAGSSTVTRLAQNIDLAPTFDDLAGATSPASSTDGHTLVPQPARGHRPALAQRGAGGARRARPPCLQTRTIPSRCPATPLRTRRFARRASSTSSMSTGSTSSTTFARTRTSCRTGTRRCLRYCSPICMPRCCEWRPVRGRRLLEGPAHEALTGLVPVRRVGASGRRG